MAIAPWVLECTADVCEGCAVLTRITEHHMMDACPKARNLDAPVSVAGRIPELAIWSATIKSHNPP